jgi:hypothetical protein
MLLEKDTRRVGGTVPEEKLSKNLQSKTHGNEPSQFRKNKCDESSESNL